MLTPGENATNTIRIVEVDVRREFLEIRERHQEVREIRVVMPDDDAVGNSGPAAKVVMEAHRGRVGALGEWVCNTYGNRAQADEHIGPGLHGLWRLFREPVGKGADVFVRMLPLDNRRYPIDKV